MYIAASQQIFPTVQRLAHFQQAVGEKDEIRFMERMAGRANFTVASYMISTPETWDSSFARECRGIVFDANGDIASRPLHKFFNLGERVGARIEDFDWSTVTRFMDKRDGSMIHTVKNPAMKNGFSLKSKKSFESDVAVDAAEWLFSRYNTYVKFCEAVVDLGATAIFEWTSPTARIVLPYSEDLMTLLHIRDNITGRYWSLGEMERLAGLYAIPLVDSADLPLHPKGIQEAIRCLQEETEGVEGWIIQFANGEMVKIKTKWYMDRHRAMTFLRERDIARLVLEEGLDDLKGVLVGDGVDISEIEDIERRVAGEIRTISGMVDSLAALAQSKGMTLKDAALTFRDEMYFGLVMSKLRGKEPNIVEWYERNILPMVSLRQLNLTNSVAELD